MIGPNAPYTAEEHRRLHNIGDNDTLARLIAEHPKNNACDDVPADPDYVPNPPYDLPAGVTSWSEWCR
ncbi:hypothetical protein [Streptomyces malaysiensis]|uniref:hypothetical protein n=1 Tax=Streptomyces malaysiensis TaxID=92644 RepID=UPI0036BE6525